MKIVLFITALSLMTGLFSCVTVHEHYKHSYYNVIETDSGDYVIVSDSTVTFIKKNK